jgi:transcriptional regulator with XRE-family HTH domain
MFRIKELATEQGLNITQLTNKAQMSYPQVHGVWSNREQNPKIATLAQIAEALNVPIWALFTDAPRPKKK